MSMGYEMVNNQIVDRQGGILSNKTIKHLPNTK